MGIDATSGSGGDGQEPDGEWGGELGRALARHASLLSRALLLVVLVVVLSNFLVSQWLEANLLSNVRSSLAFVAAWTFSHAGFDIALNADEVSLAGRTVKIVNSCIGIDASTFLASAVVVFPGSWRARFRGMATVFTAMLFANFIRILSLTFLLTASQSMFDFWHYYVWPALIILTCLAALLLWQRPPTEDA